MNTALAERYITATVKPLPPAVQDDVRAELTASITDAIDARTQQGEDPTTAERAVLTELGDPAVLAAGYTDRPLHLIGPRYFLTWWRLLKLLLAIVPAIAVAGVALAQLIAQAPIGTVIGQSIGTGIGAVVHVFFWVTIVFVILERSGADTGTSWDVDQLPEPQTTGAGRADAIASMIFGVLGIVVILWDQLRGLVHIDGASLPILHPQLWPGWLLGLIALIAAEVALALAVSARRRWTTGLAVINTGLSVVFLSWVLTLLGRGRLLNPDFLDVVFRDNGVEPDTMRILGILLVFGIVGVAVWDIIDGWLKARRDTRR